MDLSLVTLILAIVSLLGLVALLVMIVGLRSSVGQIRDSINLPSTQSASTNRGGQDSSKQMVDELLRDIADQFASFATVFSDIQGQLSEIRESVVSVGGSGQAEATERSVGAGRTGSSLSDPVPIKATAAEKRHPAASEPFSDAGTRPQTSLSNTPPLESAVQQLLDQYRQLLAEPRKSEINRWLDDNGAIRCEVTEDGEILPLGRDGGGLLALLPAGDDRALVLPSARLIADFATSFANAISMRPVTRNLFALECDGTGKMRLIEPAEVAASGERWTLVRAGTLTGLTSA